MQRILVTGGMGFIGSHFIRWILQHEPDWEVVNLDKLTYAGRPENLKEYEGHPRHRFVRGDVACWEDVVRAMEGCDAVVNFAAESHVDRSIADAEAFLNTNVIGVHRLLEAARRHKVKRFLQISTDEVYGSLPEGEADETFPLRPNSPYAASKAAADHLVMAYWVTHRLPTLVVRGSNNYGPYQFPEKFIPLMVTNALEGKPLPIYGDGQYIREWLYVEDFCHAIHLVLRSGKVGEIYNVGSKERWVNRTVAERILEELGKDRRLLCTVEDRPGHDRRYAIASEKIRALGWEPRHRFEEGLKKTIAWYQQRTDWWRPLKRPDMAVVRSIP